MRRKAVRLAESIRAWIVVDEANVFTWPGFDLVPQPDGSFLRGVITRGFVRARSRRHPPRPVANG
jgi:hypothetical protein